MKQFYLIIFLLATIGDGNKAYAVHIESSPHHPGKINLGDEMTVNDFLALDVKDYRTAGGNKLKWNQQLAFKIAQKNFTRKVQKGGLDENLNFHEAANVSPANRTGRLSLILSSVGLVFFFIPVVNIIGLGFSLAGLILGIIGLRKDEDQTMAIIGMVIGGLGVLISLLVIASVIA